jgi:hypothetical protein
VSWSAGIRRFKERPPYYAQLDGVWWAYCGYEKELGLHLIMEQNIDILTGVLLDDMTGQLLPGGESVLFSPDLKLYVAFEQPDGQDGATIKLCTRNGAVLWKGLNAILAPDGISISADIKNVRWNEKNQIMAEALTSQGKKGIVRLTQIQRGKWQWKPDSPR